MPCSEHAAGQNDSIRVAESFPHRPGDGYSAHGKCLHPAQHLYRRGKIPKYQREQMPEPCRQNRRRGHGKRPCPADNAHTEPAPLPHPGMAASGKVKGNRLDHRVIFIEEINRDQVANRGSRLIHQSTGLAEKYILSILADLGNFCRRSFSFKKRGN